MALVLSSSIYKLVLWGDIIGRKLNDLTGQRFGMLVVLRRIEDYVQPCGNKIPQWECQCDCGNICSATSSHLRSGDTKSCGCLTHKHALNFKDLTGMKFGELTAIEEAGMYTFPSGQRRKQWRCKCSCGNETVVLSSCLISGNTKSCGCRKGGYIHNLANTRIYKIHQHMMRRCYSPSDDNYHNYGERGITVCTEWFDVTTFVEWAYSHGYSDELTLDRIDVDGNYTPDNCRWVSVAVQANNKRNSVKIEYEGEIHTIAEWSSILGVPYDTLYHYRKCDKDMCKAIQYFKEGNYERKRNRSKSISEAS